MYILITFKHETSSCKKDYLHYMQIKAQKLSSCSVVTLRDEVVSKCLDLQFLHELNV